MFQTYLFIKFLAVFAKFFTSVEKIYIFQKRIENCQYLVVYSGSKITKTCSCDKSGSMTFRFQVFLFHLSLPKKYFCNKEWKDFMITYFHWEFFWDSKNIWLR